MRVTVSHNKGLEGAKQLVNQSADQVLASTATGPVTIKDVEKRWDGSTMHFSLTGKMGFFSAPLRGYIECTEKDVIIDVELPGMLTKLVPEEKIKTQLEARVRGLLNAPSPQQSA